MTNEGLQQSKTEHDGAPQPNHPPRISVTNAPREWGIPAQAEKDKQRQEVASKVVDYIAGNERFMDQDIRVTFAEKGASSLVSIIETPKEKVVLKITLDKRQGEREFLEVWKREGVAVPDILEGGLIDNEYPFTLMEFIDAKTLDANHTYDELVQGEAYVELGKTLRIMHRPIAEGYGAFVDGHGEFGTFTDYLQESKYVKDRTAYVEENHVLDDTHGSLAIAKDVLTAHVGMNPQSSYCHGDFDACNIFDTKPLTVFDPGMFINNGYLDLGLAIAIALTQRNDAAAAEQLIEGYFGDGQYDAAALHAAILFNSYFKLAGAHERRVGDEARRDQQIERVRKYLIQKRHLLTA